MAIDMDLQRGLEESAKFYQDNYDVSIYDFDESTPKIIRDQQSERCCRFCTKKEPAVRFSKKAHAISRFLGNNIWFLHNECDSCNEILFSPLEGDLAKYLQLQLNISRIKGRRGVPTVKNEASGFRMQYANNSHLELKCQAGDMTIDEAARTVTIAPNFTIQKYTPEKVVKAFIKSICSVLTEEDFAKCRSTVKWLVSKNHSITSFPILHTFVPGPSPFGHGRLIILKRKKAINVPYIWGIIEFGNFRYQVMLPYCSEDEHWLIPGEVNTFSPFYYPLNTSKEYHDRYGSPQFYVKDMSSSEAQHEKCDSMSFSFSEINKIPIRNNYDSEASLSSRSSSAGIPLPLYRLSAKFIISEESGTTEFSDFIGTFDPAKSIINISNYAMPFSFVFSLTIDRKSIIGDFSVNLSQWKNCDLRILPGCDFLKNLFLSKEVSCKIYIDGVSDNPFVVPFSDSYISQIREETFLGGLVLICEVAKIIEYEIYYDENLISSLNQIDIIAIEDFFTFQQKKSGQIETLSFTINIPADLTLSAANNKIVYEAKRSFSFFNKFVTYYVTFTVFDFVIIEEEQRNDVNTIKIQSKGKVSYETKEFVVEQI